MTLWVFNRHLRVVHNNCQLHNITFSLHFSYTLHYIFSFILIKSLTEFVLWFTTVNVTPLLGLTLSVKPPEPRTKWVDASVCEPSWFEYRMRSSWQTWQRFDLPTFHWPGWLLQSIAVTEVLISLDTYHPITFSCNGWSGSTPSRMLTKTRAIFRFQLDANMFTGRHKGRTV